MKVLRRPSIGVWLIVIVLVGAALRCYQLGKKPFWIDEMASVWFSRLSIHELWTAVPYYEAHSPFYYTLLKLWSFGGSTEAWLRGLSCLASVLCIPAAFSLVRELTPNLTSRRAGLVAAMAVAISPLQVTYAQQARPYALLTLAVIVAFLGLARFSAAESSPLEEGSGVSSVPSRRRILAAQLLSCCVILLGLSAALWLHNTSIVLVGGPVVVLCSWLVVKSRNRVRDFLLLSAVGVLALLVWSPNAVWVLHSTGNPYRGFWLRPPSPRNIASAFDVLLGSASVGPNPIAIRAVVLVAMLLMTAAGLVKAYRNGVKNGAVAAGIVILLPIASSVVISWIAMPIFLPRSMVWISVGQTAALAWFVVLGRPNHALVRLAALIATMSLALWMFFSNQDKGEPWPELVATLHADRNAPVMVVTVPNFLEYPMRWYWGGEAQNVEFYPMPAPFPAVGWSRPYPSGLLAEPSIAPEDVPAFADRVSRMRTVWLVTRFYELYDNQRLLFNYLVCMRGKPAALTSAGNLGVWRFGPTGVSGQAAAACLSGPN
jgi:hypothetical protein